MGRAAGVGVVVLVMLAGCGDDSAQPSSTSGGNTSSSIAAETPPTGSENQPLTVVVEASATEVKVGDPVVFRVTATDPDAVVKPPGTCRTIHWFGDEPARPAGCTPACVPGDFEEVPPTPGEVSETFRHVYSSPGTFTATFNYGSDRPCHEGFMYGSEGAASATITVLPSAS